MASETDDEAVEADDAQPVEVPDPMVVVYVVLFAAAFVLLGMAAPATYHLVQPAEHYVDAQQPTVIGVADDDVCDIQMRTMYWSRHGEPVDIETVLYDIDGDADTEVQRWHSAGYIAPGVNRGDIHRRVDEPLENGTYQFRFIITFESEYGWDKELDVYSEPFRVHHGTESDSEDIRANGGASISYSENARC